MMFRGKMSYLNLLLDAQSQDISQYFMNQAHEEIQAASSCNPVPETNEPSAVFVDNGAIGNNRPVIYYGQTDLDLPDTPLEPSLSRSASGEFACHNFAPGFESSWFTDEDSQAAFIYPDITRPSHFPADVVSAKTAEEPPFAMETPPATPNQDYIREAVPVQRGLFPQPRARLGGVSDLNTDDLMEFEDLHLQTDDLNVFVANAQPTSPVPTSSLETAASKPPEQLVQDDEVKPFVSRSMEAASPDWDPRLKEAWRRSQGSQSLEPLLKEELRLTIMKRRHDQGKGDLEVRFTPPPAYQLTEEDQARRDVRRAQNRGAAQRFRKKRKIEQTEIKKKLEDNEKRNRQLAREVDILRREVHRLRGQLERHRGCGDCRLFQEPGGAIADAVPDLPHFLALCQQLDNLEDIDARPR